MFARSLLTSLLCSAASCSVVGFVTLAPAVYAQPSQYRYLFVNPNTGSDANPGSNTAPLKTITQALRVVQPNTIILLAPGVYSAQTGELFPLQMQPNTTIKGEPSNRGQQVVIRGGGFYLSRSFARQNVTLLGANQAGLTGVTVSNPNPQGYGLWVESSSPVISDNTFTDSGHDGASIVGNSAPILRNNYFYQNGANGVTIYGTSRPQVQENIFENTGFGINIAQNSAPQIVGNRISQNKDGVVVQGSAQPTLRNNVIDSNSRDGLVAIAQSQPNLGTAADPGGNTFTGNGHFDVNTQHSIRTIVAAGNRLAATKAIGRLDFSGTAGAALASAAPARPVLTELPQLSQPAQPIAIAPTPQRVARPLPLPRQPNLLPGGIAIPVPAAASPVGAQPVRPQINLTLRLPTTPIEIPVPLPEGGRVARPAALPPAEPQPMRRPNGSILPVPGGNIPIGHTAGSSVRIWSGAARLVPNTPSVASSNPFVGSLRFRVVVSAATEEQQMQLRSLVPGAFAIRGSVMQAGAFSDRSKADELLQLLLQQGLNAQVEQL